MNGTSSGLCPEQADIDNEIIRDLTLEKMNAELCRQAVVDQELDASTVASTTAAVAEDETR